MMHRCPWPKCDMLVARNKFACRVHWYMLPNKYRAWLGRSYRQGITDGDHPNVSHTEALRAALAWIAQREQRKTGEYRTPPDDGERDDLPC